MGGDRGQGSGPQDGAPVGALSRDQVLDAAMEIVETDGVQHLTVRSLSAKLGVAVTAIYWHVGDKQALLDGVVDRIVADFGEVRVRGGRPDTRIMSIGRSLRRTLLERPDLVALVHRQGRTAALFQPARRVLVHELTDAGLRGRDAALAVQAVLNLVVGSVLVDRQLQRQPAQRETPEELWQLETWSGPDELVEHLSRPLGEEALFEYTLRALVRTILPD